MTLALPIDGSATKRGAQPIPAAQPSALWYAGCLGALILVALFLSGIVMQLMERQTRNSNYWLKERLRGEIEAISQLQKPNANSLDPGLVLVFGASDVENSFKPDVFDASMEKLQSLKKTPQFTVSYNLAARNSNAIFPDLAQRVVEELNNKAWHAKAIFVKFTPSRMTSRAASNARLGRATEDLKSLIMSARSLSGQFRENTNTAFRLVIDRYVFGGMSATSASGYTSDFLYASLDRKNRNQNAEFGSKVMSSLWLDPELNPLPAWDAQTRGAFNFGLPASSTKFDRVMQAYQSPQAQAAIVDWHQRCCDAVALHFDDLALSEFIKAVRALGSVAEHVFVYTFADSAAMPHDSEAQARLKRVLEQIGEESGAVMLGEESGLSFSSDQYLDAIHLNQAGGIRLSQLLSESLSASFR
jgi:hypothetical protein